MREIGSEFSSFAIKKNFQDMHLWLPKAEDYTFVFSGRTAIEMVLEDIGVDIKKALLPSYCCESMIEPFKDRGIEVDFYTVKVQETLQIDLEIPHDCQILFWCNYFGYKTLFPEKIVQDFLDRGGIVIEDITHSLFSETQAHKESAYLVASLRKWDGLLSGGLVVKKRGILKNKQKNPPTAEYINDKKKAMQIKKAYLENGNDTQKEQYLSLFAKCNAWLAEHFSGLTMDEDSQKSIFLWDIEFIKQRRKENARFLHEQLKDIPWISFMFSKELMECPLFVPVLLETQKRQTLRQKLIDNQIYCPVHWPKPSASCMSDLYDRELSIICDQRYTIEDMARIVNVIKSK